MTNGVSNTYGNGWLKYDNQNAKVIENQNHGQAMTNTARRQQRVQNNQNALEQFRQMLTDDNYNQDIDIFVTERTVNGKTQSKQAGQTYDLGDIFTQLAAEGYIKDDDGQGFTRANAKSLGDAVAQANQKDSPFHKFFTRSKDSTQFSVNRELAMQFLEAAGYSRAKEVKPEPQPEVKPEPQPEVKPEPQPEGNEKISNMGLKNTEQLLIQALGFTNEDNVCIDFKGELKPTADGKYVKSGTIVVKGSHDQPDSEGDKLKFKVEKDGTIKMKRAGVGNWFRKWQVVGKAQQTPAQEAAQETSEE